MSGENMRPRRRRSLASSKQMEHTPKNPNKQKTTTKNRFFTMINREHFHFARIKLKKKKITGYNRLKVIFEMACQSDLIKPIRHSIKIAANRFVITVLRTDGNGSVLDSVEQI